MLHPFTRDARGLNADCWVLIAKSKTKTTPIVKALKSEREFFFVLVGSPELLFLHRILSNGSPPFMSVTPMAENSSALFSVGQPQTEPQPWLVSLDRTVVAQLLQVVVGFALIMATVWTIGPLQRRLFWTSAAWFGAWALIGLWNKPLQGFRLPSVKFSILIICAAILFAGALVAGAAGLGTLHGLFGARDPLRHASSYICWAIIQQYIQQIFFFSRFEQVTRNGLRASFSAAFLFGVAHLPNPELAQVTFLGGWLLSELFRRYRTVLPLGFGHGLIGIAIAISVPDHIQHHMRVGLSYLHYIG